MLDRKESLMASSHWVGPGGDRADRYRGSKWSPGPASRLQLPPTSTFLWPQPDLCCPALSQEVPHHEDREGGQMGQGEGLALTTRRERNSA